MQEELHYAEDCILLIKDMGFELFMAWGITHGFIQQGDVELSVQVLIEELAAMDKFEECAFLQVEFQRFRGKCLN